jgi:DNA polymerase III delta subunit
MPGRLTPAAARAQIAAGTIEPLYLVTGDDEAEMSAIGTALSESIDDDFRAFNVQRFYGSDAGSTLAAVLDAASTLPLLAPRRVVILHQAERALTARKGRQSDTEGEGDGADAGEGGGSKTQLALLKDYAKRPHGHAAVAIIGLGLERTFDALATQAAVVVCEASSDVIRRLGAEHGVRFERDAADLLRQMAGADVGRLRADVERVLLYAAGRKTVSRDQVQEVIGRAASAGGKKLWTEVAERRASAALKELELELAEGAVPVMVLGLLRSAVERTVAPTDLSRALDAVLRTDLALKTSGGDPRVLLERLIVELCGMGKDAGR